MLHPYVYNCLPLLVITSPLVDVRVDLLYVGSRAGATTLSEDDTMAACVVAWSGKRN